MGTCAACYHGTRFSFHYWNSKYVRKHLPTTLIRSLQQTTFGAASYHLFLSQYRNSSAILSFKTHVANGSFAEHYWRKQISSNSLVYEFVTTVSTTEKFTYTSTFTVTQPALLSATTHVTWV